MQNVRNGLLVGVAALYVWNVIDGIVANGREHVITMGNTRMKFLPYTTIQSGVYAGGLSVNLNF
jgi:hypothetical protein